MPSVQAQRAYYERNREKVLARSKRQRDERRKDQAAMQTWDRYARDKMLKARYGITSKEYDSMLSSQGGGCAVCNTTNPGNGRGDRFFDVDHCHATGRVRGLLCRRCNIVAGVLEKNPQRTAQVKTYLELKGG